MSMQTNDEDHLLEIIQEITSYVSPEVNFLEASGIYVTKHQMDAETFAMLVNKHPILWSNIYECALKQKQIKHAHTHAILQFF